MVGVFRFVFFSLVEGGWREMVLVNFCFLFRFDGFLKSLRFLLGRGFRVGFLGEIFLSNDVFRSRE